MTDLNAKYKQIDVIISSANKKKEGLAAQYAGIVTEITRSTTILNNL